MKEKQIQQAELREAAGGTQLEHEMAHKTSQRSAEELLHELQNRHIELEMQNEELRRVQKFLQNEIKKNQLLMRNASDGVHILDSAGNVIEASDTFCTMLGYHHDEIIGMNVSQWEAKFGEAELTEMGRRLFAQKRRIQFETRNKRNDGTIIDVEVSGFPVELDGNLVMFCSTREITERRKLDEEFREQESLLRQFIDHAPAALAMFDRNMHYISVSKRWIEDYSLGDIDIIGRSHYEIFPEIQDDWKDVHRRGLTGEVIRAEEDHFVRNDGTLQWLKWEVQPWHTGSGNVGGIIIYSESITELKRIELQLHELAAHLQNVRDEEKTTIASEIHDDLGGTLTSIMMAAHSLRYAILEEKNKQLLLDTVGEILKSTDHASGVTRQIVTGLYPTILDDLGILAALEWQAANFQKNTGIICSVSNIQGNVEPSNELDKRYRMALFRIAQEALTNVSRHSYASKVEIEFSCAADEVVLSIIDNGRGILNLEANRTGRFGILSMRERARQLGGRIILETPFGGGLSVTAIFPLHRH